MQQKTYTKEQMVHLLTSLSGHLSEHTAQFPGVAASVVALAAAAKDPMTATAKVTVKKEKKPPKVKPVTINYEGQSILVTTPWGKAGKALADAFKVLVGKRAKRIDPQTGEPFFLTCFDKKVKAHRLPMDKKDEVLKAIAESGLPVEG